MFTGLCARSQKTSDVDFKRVGDNIVVTYNLSARANITLFMSINGGSWTVVESVTGDVGPGVNAGRKRIEWDVFEDFPDGINADVVFLVAPNVGTFTEKDIPAELHAEKPIISDYKAYWAKKSNHRSEYAGDVRKWTFASPTDRWSFTLDVFCYDFLKRESSKIYTHNYSGRSMRNKPFGEYRNYFKDEPEPPCILTINETGNLCIDNKLLK